MSWVLFLGVCLGFYYFLTWVVFPKVGLDLIWGAIVKALVESCLIPLCNLMECCDFDFDNVGLGAGMDDVILVGPVDVFC